jgi:hypothetical protein
MLGVTNGDVPPPGGPPEDTQPQQSHDHDRDADLQGGGTHSGPAYPSGAKPTTFMSLPKLTDRAMGNFGSGALGLASTTGNDRWSGLLDNGGVTVTSSLPAVR